MTWKDVCHLLILRLCNTIVCLPESVADAQHLRRVLVRNVVIQVWSSECPEGAVPYAGQHDAKEY